MENANLQENDTARLPGEMLWSHAVNSKEKLDIWLAPSKNIDIIEGDIRVSPDGTIIMAHPPENTSDLTFDEWIERVVASGKMAKLDFKDFGAIEYAANKLLKMNEREEITVPIIFNADVLRGPGGGMPNVLKINDDPENREYADPTYVTDMYKKLQNVLPTTILSVGWTTSVDGGSYTQEHVDAMLTLIEDVSGPVTFPVRICLAQGSMDALNSALGARADTTLDWWNNEPVTAEQVKYLKESTDPKTSYYDVIDDDWNPIPNWQSIAQ